MRNLSKRDINLLLIVIGLAIILLTYFLVFTNLSSQVETLNADTEQMRPRLTQLQDYAAAIPLFEEGILEASARIDEERLSYPEQVRTEDLIMYAVMLEEEMGVRISSASFNPPTLISEFYAPNAEGTLVRYQAYITSMAINSAFGYDPLKDAINRIYATADKTLLDDITLTFDGESGGLAGNMTISKIFVTDGSYVYSPTQIPAGPFGNTNPFATITAPVIGDVEDSETVDGGDIEETAAP